MAIVVEHEKRRREILERALDVFVEEGFENATYQKIADRSGITRTTLYTYFRNKREIFNYSIKQLMSNVERDILGVQEDGGLSWPAKIKKTLFLILGRLKENKRLLSVILGYLLSLPGMPAGESGKNKKTLPSRIQAFADTKVRRRTIRLRHILASMIIGGTRAGQLKKVDVRTVNDLLYGLMETAIFRLAVLKRDSAAELEAAIELTVDGLLAE